MSKTPKDAHWWKLSSELSHSLRPITFTTPSLFLRNRLFMACHHYVLYLYPYDDVFVFFNEKFRSVCTISDGLPYYKDPVLVLREYLECSPTFYWLIAYHLFAVSPITTACNAARDDWCMIWFWLPVKLLNSFSESGHYGWLKVHLSCLVENCSFSLFSSLVSLHYCYLYLLFSYALLITQYFLFLFILMREKLLFLKLQSRNIICWWYFLHPPPVIIKYHLINIVNQVGWPYSCRDHRIPKTQIASFQNYRQVRRNKTFHAMKYGFHYEIHTIRIKIKIKWPQKMKPLWINIPEKILSRYTVKKQRTDRINSVKL